MTQFVQPRRAWLRFRSRGQRRVAAAAAGLVLVLAGLFGQAGLPATPALGQAASDLEVSGLRSASSPGATVTFTLSVANRGAAATTVELDADGAAWTAWLPEPVEIPAGTARDLVVGFEVPLGARDGDIQPLSVAVLADGGRAATQELVAWIGGRARIGRQTGCRFDLDQDGSVSLDDVDRVERHLTRRGEPGYDPNLDFDHSGAIDRFDVERTVDALRPACAPLIEVDSQALQAAMVPARLRAHLEALQAIADANGGNRAARTPGFEASVDYVAAALEAAGYAVTRQPFDIPTFVEQAPPALARLTPDPLDFGVDEIATFGSSGSGVVTASLAAVDLQIPPGAVNSSTSGCQDQDFAGFPAGAVALMQRGTCGYAEKVNRALAAGASAVILMNEGQADRTGVLRGSAGSMRAIPVLGASYAVGEALAASLDSGAVTLRVEAHGALVPQRCWNVLAETAGGREDRVILLGGHLDSVPAGPGINDNGSGSAAILELALQVAALDIKPVNTLRFAFWGGEELGLLGSRHYVEQLDPAARSDILANLNFDMIGSPNFFRGVYDGDGSMGGDAPSGPPGSGEIEQLFTGYFAQRELPQDPTAFDGRSDYGPFIAAGIPAGGLFTGAEAEKSALMARRYGGTEGQAYDACYHRACDTIENIDWTVLDEMADAIAHTSLALAMDRYLPLVSGRLGRLGLDGPPREPIGLLLPWLQR